jgi:hypothetical protein
LRECALRGSTGGEPTLLCIRLITMTTIPRFRLSITSAEPAASVSTQLELDFAEEGALAKSRPGRNRHQRTAPDLPNSTTQHIGQIGKRKLIFTDPYSGGEQSGKRAKADALSAPANARFRSLATSEGQDLQ